ncbi:hypothetical protein FF80_01883 [Devosia sp. LC5]|uniref:hypothetical protein n=1 Tax=Devosia sp. LC5 TaxID=1502724 RepID=UPI0004E34A9E|nr:hypothetical protein [Devosia sp. LC5]KFC68443.1 hypothetical protein FF80_01883 [Devosia sp. LC5]
MSAAALLATIGLTLNMVGVIFAFVWGHPQPDHDTSVSIGVGELPSDYTMSTGETYAAWVKRKRDRKRRFTALSRAGLGLMFAGFAFQLIAVFLLG